MKQTNALVTHLNTYVEQQEAHGDVCNINDVLQIVSETVSGILPPKETAKIQLYHAEPYTTVVITVPGDSDIAKQGPYKYKLRTSFE